MPRKTPTPPPGTYHLVARVVNKEIVLDEVTCEFFVKVLHAYAHLLGFQIITYCVVPHHFQLLVVLSSAGSDALITLDDWEARLHAAMGPQSMLQTTSKIKQLRQNADQKETRQWLNEQMKRRHSLSEFVKSLKMRVCRWYNWKHNSSGVFWETRFDYSMVAPEDIPSAAAAIDLLPVRDGIVTNPADYRWSGYAASRSAAASPA